MFLYTYAYDTDPLDNCLCSLQYGLILLTIPRSCVTVASIHECCFVCAQLLEDATHNFSQDLKSVLYLER